MGVQALFDRKGGYGHETAFGHQDLSWVVDMLVLIPAKARQSLCTWRCLEPQRCIIGRDGRCECRDIGAVGIVAAEVRGQWSWSSCT